MVMKRVFALALAVTLGAGCSKPSAEDCRKALTNMQHLLGTENLSKSAGDQEGEVRRCKGGSSKEAVHCAMSAQTLEDLKKCEFYKSGKTDDEAKPDDKPAGSGS
jgi:hypothetical protein